MTSVVVESTGHSSVSGDADVAPTRGRHAILTRAGAGILLAIGVLFTVLSTKLPFGSFLEPDTGTWPLMVSVALAFFGAISLALPERDAEALDTPHSEVWWFLVALAICGVYGVLFWATGYFISTAVFVFAVAHVFARPRWWHAALVALSAGAGIWALFEFVLALPAP